VVEAAAAEGLAWGLKGLGMHVPCIKGMLRGDLHPGHVSLLIFD